MSIKFLTPLLTLSLLIGVYCTWYCHSVAVDATWPKWKILSSFVKILNSFESLSFPPVTAAFIARTAIVESTQQETVFNIILFLRFCLVRKSKEYCVCKTGSSMFWRCVDLMDFSLGMLDIPVEYQEFFANSMFIWFVFITFLFCSC